MIYIVTMLRNGERETHHYIIGAYTDLAQAYIDGIEHGHFHRANKYEPLIQECAIDDDHIQEVPLTVALNFAKMKFPERFDDRGKLKQEDELDRSFAVGEE